METIFSPYMESAMMSKFDEMIDKVVASKLVQNDVITQKVVLEDYDITHGTLRKWETNGLKRFEPPIEDTRCVYYRRSEIEKFIGAR